VSVTIFIGNLAFDAAPIDVEQLCTPFGHVVRVSIPPANRPGFGHRGFCFVEFADEAAAHRAVNELDGTVFFERPLRVTYATEGQR
jgi:RNA recognition motif-containing protein